MDMLKGIGQLILIPLPTGHLAGFTAYTDGRICEKTLGSYGHITYERCMGVWE